MNPDRSRLELYNITNETFEVGSSRTWDDLLAISLRNTASVSQFDLEIPGKR